MDYSRLYRKPVNCQCREGTWRQKSVNWVCLESHVVRSHLKCLACGWKWWSDKSYRHDLQQHQERSRTGCTDEMILARLLDGDLRICPITSVVESLRRDCWNPLTQIPDRQGGGYSFVEVCCRGRKKKIGVHVLQWMAANRRTVPRGFDVHHKRSPPRPEPKCNALENLALRDAYENQCDSIRNEF